VKQRVDEICGMRALRCHPGPTQVRVIHMGIWSFLAIRSFTSKSIRRRLPRRANGNVDPSFDAARITPWRPPI